MFYAQSTSGVISERERQRERARERERDSRLRESQREEGLESEESEDKNAATYLAGAKVWQQQPSLLSEALHTRQEVTNRHTGDPIHTCILYTHNTDTHTKTPQWHGLLLVLLRKSGTLFFPSLLSFLG